MKPRIVRSRVPDLLKSRGKNQVDLAIYLQVSEAHVSQVCNGDGQFSMIKAKMAADFLGCRIEDLNEWSYSRK